MSNAAPGPDGVVCAHDCDAWSVDSQCPQHGSIAHLYEDEKPVRVRPRSNPLGFVVLARRPNPYREDPWDYRPIGKLYPSAPAAITALAKGELADDVEREVIAYRIDRDSSPGHRHHRDCIHNLTPEEQIAMRGRTAEWWRDVGAEWPKQIYSVHWQYEPKPDPVEYVVYPVGEWSAHG